MNEVKLEVRKVNALYQLKVDDKIIITSDKDNVARQLKKFGMPAYDITKVLAI